LITQMTIFYVGTYTKNTYIVQMCLSLLFTNYKPLVNVTYVKNEQ